MRIVPVLALLLTTAACAWPPPPAPQAAAAPVAAAGAPLPLMPAVAAAPTPPAPPTPAAAAAVVATAPSASPVAVPAVFAPIPFARYFTPWAGRLELSNFSYSLTDVEAIVTPYPDCALHPGVVPLDFKLPLNGTWVIPASPGMDVCWRREVAAEGQSPQSHQWTQWNRAFTSSGGLIDSRL